MEESPNIPVAELPEQLKLLEAHGRELANRGRHEEAERLFREVSRAAPNHIPALRYLASRALLRQDFDVAQNLIERAIRLARNVPALHQHLAIILRARGYLEGALLAFDTTLQLRPAQPLCWIQRGDVLQALGRHEEAIASYKRAADFAGDLGMFARSHRGGAKIRQIIMRAAKFLTRARDKAITDGVASIRRRHDEKTLHRVIAAGRHMALSVPPNYEDPLQRPAFCYCPGLEARPFFEHRKMPFLRELEATSEAIRGELEALLLTPDDFKPYVEIPTDQAAQWHTLNHSSKWSAYHLYRDGMRVEEHCGRCPRTAEAVEKLPLARMQPQAPEVFFSILKPGTHIPPHFGIANYKLAVHLPLIVPTGCAIRVGDETRSWTPGKCLIFDDSFEHEAWNRSDKLRAVLIFEIWNPALTPVEQDYLSTALSALDGFNRKMAIEFRRPGA